GDAGGAAGGWGGQPGDGGNGLSRREARPPWRAGSDARQRALTSFFECEAARLTLPLRPLTALGQEQEPGMRGAAAGGRGGLGTVMAQPKKRNLINGRSTRLRPRKAVASGGRCWAMETSR